MNLRVVENWRDLRRRERFVLMGDIGLLKQGWCWLRSRKQTFVGPQAAAASCAREWYGFFVDRHWPVLYNWCVRLGRLVLLVVKQWKDCLVRGFWSLSGFDYTAMFVILWSAFLSLTSTSCLLYVLLVLGAAGAVIYSLGYTPGLFIVGLFGILVMWIYGNFWATGILFLIGGYMFSLNHARLLIFMATSYSLYLVYIRVGWIGIFLSLNLAFLSNDIFGYFLQGYDYPTEGRQFKGCSEKEPIAEDIPQDHGSSDSTFETESTSSFTSSCKVSNTSSSTNIQMESRSKVVKSDSESLYEMKRIMGSRNHYEALGLPQNKIIDLIVLKKEYHKKAMLVHPDKNLGNLLASDSFKKLQCAYEVLSDISKRKDYDEKLRRDELKNVYQMPSEDSTQNVSVYQSEESRRIECTKCGNTHLWICTTRSKACARWCQDCHRYHPAKDGDGWVEFENSRVTPTSQKVEIPRAFVCAESKIFDVSEWAVCQFQGMTCRPNTHRPSFHVNMVGLDKASQRTSSSRFNWEFDAEMISEDEDEFEIWLQQALASGLFTETPKRRKSWSPFKINPKMGMKSWRRSA